MSSGVKVSDEVVSKYNELKTGRAYKFILFKLNDTNDEIVVEKVSGKTDSYDDFLKELKALPKEECRYAVFDFEWTTSEGGQRNKICFYTWCPDNSAMKKKMLYASSKDAIKKKLVGIGAEIQGTDFSEIDYDSILERVAKGPGNQ